MTTYPPLPLFEGRRADEPVVTFGARALAFLLEHDGLTATLEDDALEQAEHAAICVVEGHHGHRVGTDQRDSIGHRGDPRSPDEGSGQGCARIGREPTGAAVGRQNRATDAGGAAEAGAYGCGEPVLIWIFIAEGIASVWWYRRCVRRQHGAHVRACAKHTP